MQFLFEEFFGKVRKLSEGKTSFTLAIMVKILIFILFFGIIALLIYLFVKEKFLIIVVVIGLVLLAEIAHYFRKSRENLAVKEQDNQRKKHVREVLKPVRVKNKKGLLMRGKQRNKKLLNKNNLKKIRKRVLKVEKARNKNLLKSSRAKNKEMINEKVKAVKVGK